MPNYRKLIEKLSELYPTIDDSKLALTLADITKTGKIAFNNSAQINWMNIIKEVEKQKNLEKLIQFVVDEYNDEELLKHIKEETQIVPYQDASNAYREELAVDKEKLKELVAAGELENVVGKLKLIANELPTSFQNSIVLLTGRLTALNKENADGLLERREYKLDRNKIAASLNYQIDQIDKQKEIKSILRDLSPAKPELSKLTNLNVPPPSEFEKVMRGKETIVAIEWLSDALENAKIVCKVKAPSGGSGTGFLVKGGYVLTNHHVVCKHFPYHERECELACLESHGCTKNGQVLLNYQIASKSGETVAYDLDPEHTCIINPALDYALIKVKDNPEKPLAQWGIAEFEATEKPQIGDLVNIIQHPNGQRKKIALPDEVLSVWHEKNYLFYMADTKEGSSGSPVFNQDWKVIALHHAGKDEDDGGMTINAAGEKHEANRGILIGAILEDLKNQGINL